MANLRGNAQKLLSDTELQAFDATRGEALRGLSKTDIRKHVERARKLRDKYRDLYRRQRVASHGKPDSEASNLRTQQKEAIFTDIVERLEKRLGQIETQEDRDYAKLQRQRPRDTARDRDGVTGATTSSKTRGQRGERSPAGKSGSSGVAARKPRAGVTAKTTDRARQTRTPARDPVAVAVAVAAAPRDTVAKPRISRKSDGTTSLSNTVAAESVDTRPAKRSRNAAGAEPDLRTAADATLRGARRSPAVRRSTARSPRATQIDADKNVPAIDASPRDPVVDRDAAPGAPNGANGGIKSSL
ncbi:hypothetical protein [Chitinasiproducens palmae]|uniref:Uncharacterized protein n=1 Tax=Chitinasiproducens palmae TaxID=1770053 RepID=A0A1H2PP15_9BURK|nr:hypothetical protein [Chitinasiproducens palmae]SDV47609.1 hypothetical protein SAMN05216551_103149 [Chitinasiproducens palmae]